MNRSARAPLGESARRGRMLLFILSLLLVAGSAIAGSADVGRCLTAEIPEPVVMPDGKVFPANRMTICYRMAYSPVMGLQEISIDGDGLGMYMTRSTEGPRPEWTLLENPRVARLPYLIFMRNSRNELELHSYHRPIGDKVQHHIFAASGNPRVTSHWSTVSSLETGEAPEQRGRKKSREFDLAAAMEQDNTVVLFAAAP